MEETESFGRDCGLDVGEEFLGLRYFWAWKWSLIYFALIQVTLSSLSWHFRL
jgi:hypothetical protein